MRDHTGNAAWGALSPTDCEMYSLQSAVWDETTYKQKVLWPWSGGNYMKKKYVPIILDYYSGQFL